MLDFVCLAHRLIIEADGPFHDPARDTHRDQWLAAQGFHVLRFANNDILGASPAIIDTILNTASLLPSREKGPASAPRLKPSPPAGRGVNEADG